MYLLDQLRPDTNYYTFRVLLIVNQTRNTTPATDLPFHPVEINDHDTAAGRMGLPAFSLISRVAPPCSFFRANLAKTIMSYIVLRSSFLPPPVGVMRAFISHPSLVSPS